MRLTPAFQILSTLSSVHSKIELKEEKSKFYKLLDHLLNFFDLKLKVSFSGVQNAKYFGQKTNGRRWIRESQTYPGPDQFRGASRGTFNGPSYSGLKAQWPLASSILTLIPPVALPCSPNQTLHRGGGYIKASPDPGARVLLRSSHSPPPPPEPQALQLPELARLPTMVSEKPRGSICRCSSAFVFCCRC
jgi:hypothetical protein